MAKREELYRKFGPLLIEALALVLLEEINTLRAAHGMPPIFEADFLEQLLTQISNLNPFDWMHEQENFPP